MPAAARSSTPRARRRSCARTLGTIGPLEAAVARSIHRLVVLVGREPGALRAELAPPQNLPPLPGVVPVGDPAGLLRRRPDIRIAERELAGATARIGIAIADLFPRVTFTGNAGLRGGHVRRRWATAAPTPTCSLRAFPGRIFDLGHVQARIGAASGARKARCSDYEQTVLQALEETEDSLVTHARARDRLVHDEAAVTRQQHGGGPGPGAL